MKMTEPEDKIVAEATAGLPNGMTQEEADRLVLEADRKQKENT